MDELINAEDIEAISKIVLMGLEPWDHKDLKYIKDKIRKHLIEDIPIARCCYCQRSFVGEFKFDIDTEHILPKSEFENLIYNLNNLNIACKRCNMNIKNDRVDFIVNRGIMGNDYFHSNHYKFIHPNLDTYRHHLIRKERREGDFIFLKFIIKNDTKGKYTYDFFELKRLEIDNINYAQGLKSAESITEKVYNMLLITKLKFQKI